MSHPRHLRRRSAAAAAAALLLSLAAVGCGGDPYLDALEQRARWTVSTPSPWVATDGGYRLTTRLVGPPSSDLETLTVAIDLLDGNGERIDRVWHTYDLADVPRGGPKDVSVHVPAPPEAAVEEISIRLVLDPTAEEAGHIEELRGLSRGGESTPREP